MLSDHDLSACFRPRVLVLTSRWCYTGRRWTEESTTVSHAEATESFVDPINVPKLGSTSELLLLSQLQSHDHPQQSDRIYEAADSRLLLPCRSEVLDSDIYPKVINLNLPV